MERKCSTLTGRRERRGGGKESNGGVEKEMGGCRERKGIEDEDTYTNTHLQLFAGKAQHCQASHWQEV